MPLHKDIIVGSGVVLRLESDAIDEFEEDVREGLPANQATLEEIVEILRAKTRIVVERTPDGRAKDHARIIFDAPQCVRIIFPKNIENFGNR